ncbi:MAG TPA: hypothetical protein VH327_02805 [Gammaproteobacteria bacterium]|jgi:hypothetical protein|nr:hypothetical protein [Gammaproteobacteria bacterium]
MRTLASCCLLLLLTACASMQSSTGIDTPMHPEGNQQVGWQQVTTGDGDPLFVVRSSGKGSYSAMIEVAETQAAKLCPDGYGVLDIEGNDQPQVETLSPKFVLASELRFKVRCYEKDSEN